MCLFVAAKNSSCCKFKKRATGYVLYNPFYYYVAAVDKAVQSSSVLL